MNCSDFEDEGPELLSVAASYFLIFTNEPTMLKSANALALDGHGFIGLRKGFQMLC